MTFKRYGSREIGRWIDANVAQANRLYDLAEAHPEFAPATKPRMSAVCIRYRPAGLDELYYWAVVPVIALVGAIPISPQGAGVMEFFTVLLTKGQGVTVSQAMGE